MTEDLSGCAVSLSSPVAVEAWNDMTRAFLAHSATTPGHLGTVLETEPDFAMGLAAKGLFSMMLGRREMVGVAREAHAALADGLVGAEATCVAVYETVAREDVDSAALEASELICFFAPSAVRAYVALALDSTPLFWGHGPTTRAAMAAAGLESIDNPPW